MTSPLLAMATTHGRLYRKPTTDPAALPETIRGALDLGLLMPSVTNVIGLMDKPHLLTWYGKMAAEAAVSVNVSHPGLMESRPRDAVDWLKNAALRSSNQSGALGDEVHNAVELLADGSPAEVGDDAQLFVNGWHQFIADFSPEFLHLEATCFGQVDGGAGPLGYAGTADFVARINGLVVVGDTKTGKNIHTEATLQLTSLAHADHLVDADGNLAAMPHIDGGVILHLTRNGYKLYPVPLTGENWDTFSGLRRVWDFHQENLVSRAPLGVDAPIGNAGQLTFGRIAGGE